MCTILPTPGYTPADMTSSGDLEYMSGTTGTLYTCQAAASGPATALQEYPDVYPDGPDVYSDVYSDVYPDGVPDGVQTGLN